MFGFCLFFALQLNGITFSANNDRVPFIAIFVVTNTMVFSLIDHKEQRFISCILPLCGLFFAVTLITIVQLERNIFLYSFKGNAFLSRKPVSLTKVVLNTLLVIYVAFEMR